MAGISRSPSETVLPPVLSGKPAPAPESASTTKEQEKASSAADKVEPTDTERRYDALNSEVSNKFALERPSPGVEQKLILSRLETLPPEILDPIVQIVLDEDVKPEVLAGLSHKFLGTTFGLIFFRLEVVLTSAERHPALPISVAQWLEAKKYNAWLDRIFKVIGTNNVEKYTGFKEFRLKSLSDRLYSTGLNALSTGLASWCKAEQALGNSAARAQAAEFEAVYIKNECMQYAHSKGLYKIPEQIGFLQSLEVVNFAGNNLSEIPSALYDLSNIRNLALNSNQITRMSSNVKLLRNLRALNLFGNCITELPFQLGELKNLIWLNAGSNDIQRFVVSTGQFTQLKSLFLMHNAPLKTISEELASLPNLEFLNVSENFNLDLPLAIKQSPRIIIIK